MTRWLRLYPGTMRDPKLVSIALRTGQKKHLVAFVWLCILESASEMHAGGAYRLDPREVANFLECRPVDIAMVLAALEQDGLIGKGQVTNWAKRQYEKEADEPLSGAERTRLWRERQLQQERDDAVTPRDDAVTPRDEAVTAAVTPASPIVTPESESQSEPEKKNNGTATARAKPDRPPRQASLLLPIDGGNTPAPPRAKPDYDRLEAALRAAAGESLNAVSTGLMILSDPLRWLENGCDLDLDVLPALRAVAARPSTRPGAVRTWNFFSGAVFEARDRRQTGPPAAVSPGAAEIIPPNQGARHAARHPAERLAAAFRRVP
jgi:hypothetical protein